MAYSLDKLVRVRQLAACGEARRRRIAADVSLSELAADVGVSYAAIWKWETQRRRPSGPAAIKYLDALERLAELGTVTA